MAVDTRARPAAEPAASSADLVRRYSREVYLLSFRILGRREDAEDAAQETFLALFRGRTKLEGAASEKAWVMTVARNTAISLGRSRRRPALLVDDLLQAPPIESPADPERLNQALAALSEEERLLLQMKFQEKKSPAEMGEAVGKSPGAAATALCRALARLRQQYQGEAP